MTRNLRALMVSALAVLAMGAVGVQGAQGALFHSEITNTTLTVRSDGTGKTAHQVFDVANGSVTCAGITGHGSMAAETETSVTVEVTYVEPCTYVGQLMSINMGQCDYTFTSHGKVSITNSTGGNCAAVPITITAPSPPCTLTISNAGGKNQNLGTVTYKTVGAGVNREITIAPNVPGVHYTAHGSGCPKVGTFEDGAITTGNAFVTGETIGGAMVGIWWE